MSKFDKDARKKLNQFSLSSVSHIPYPLSHPPIYSITNKVFVFFTKILVIEIWDLKFITPKGGQVWNLAFVIWNLQLAALCINFFFITFANRNKFLFKTPGS